MSVFELTSVWDIVSKSIAFLFNFLYERKNCHKEQYRYLRRFLNLFWDHWRKMYLKSMTGRSKWKSLTDNFAVRYILFQIYPSLRWSQWNLGRVVKIFPGPGGLVRKINVKLEWARFVEGIETSLCWMQPPPILYQSVWMRGNIVWHQHSASLVFYLFCLSLFYFPGLYTCPSN